MEEALINDRMYVFVRKDIPYIHSAVQAGHAVAQYFIQHPRPKDWHNGTLVYLQVADEDELSRIVRSFSSRGLRYAAFLETDWTPLPQLTAVAYIGYKDEFVEFKTLNLDCIFTKLKKAVKRLFRRIFR